MPDATRSRRQDPAVDLQAALVTYDDAPDRRTLYPADASETERLTRWLTADADDFVRLDERR